MYQNIMVYYYLDIPDDEIKNLNLPMGIPFELTLDKNLKSLVPLKFLGDEEIVKKSMDDVSIQGK